MILISGILQTKSWGKKGWKAIHEGIRSCCSKRYRCMASLICFVLPTVFTIFHRHSPHLNEMLFGIKLFVTFSSRTLRTNISLRHICMAIFCGSNSNSISHFLSKTLLKQVSYCFTSYYSRHSRRAGQLQLLIYNWKWNCSQPFGFQSICELQYAVSI